MTIQLIREWSAILNQLENEGKIAIVGAMYDITSAEVIPDAGSNLEFAGAAMNHLPPFAPRP